MHCRASCLAETQPVVQGLCLNKNKQTNKLFWVSGLWREEISGKSYDRFLLEVGTELKSLGFG